MAKILKDIIDKCKNKYLISLLAGKSGLSKSVSWVYLAEDIDNINFIKSNELIITTGYFTVGDISLYDYISALIAADMSGLIINTGKYITEIPKDIIDFCDENNFPLFAMPWEIHLTDVMQELCAELLKYDKQQNNLSEAFIYAIENKNITDNHRDILTSNGFNDNIFYRIINVKSDIYSAELLNYSVYFVKYNDNSIVISTDDSILKIINEKFNKYTVGISSREKGINRLYYLYKQSQDALKAAKMLNKNIVYYDDTGILSIIFAVEDKELLKNYYKKRLNIFEEYDIIHNSSLIDTLYYYLITGGSLAETADIMFTHRNTVGYRMNKIREISGIKFDNTKEKYEYLTAIYIKKYLEAQNGLFIT